MPNTTTVRTRRLSLVIAPSALVVMLITTVVFSAFAQTGFITTATPDQVRELTGSTEVKVVFIVDRDVYLIDYSQPAAEIRKLNGMSNAFFPVISPCGRFVTYQTGTDNEGPCADCNSSIWIRPLTVDGTPVKIADNGYVPRFIDSTAHGHPEVIYATSLNCPRASWAPWWPRDTLAQCWKAGQTVKRKIIEGIAVQEPEVVFAGGSYYGGLSYDHRYLNTAWPASCPNPMMIDLKGNSLTPQPMHVIPVKNKTTGTDSLLRINCCNPSRSPSRIFTNTMMYFDFGWVGPVFGYEHPTWRTWGQHQFFFISRMTPGTYGEVIRLYGLPTDQPIVSTREATGEPVEMEWINPEWSNHPYYATAALQVNRLFRVNGRFNRTYNKEAIYLIDLHGNKGLRLIQTTDTTLTSNISATYPYVWVKVPDDFQEDPAWLADVNPERPDIVRIQSFTGKQQSVARIAIKGNLLTSSHEISGATVFSGLGRAVWTYQGGSTQPVLLPSVRPGIYFVKVEGLSTKFKTVRWIVR